MDRKTLFPGVEPYVPCGWRLPKALVTAIGWEAQRARMSPSAYVQRALALRDKAPQERRGHRGHVYCGPYGYCVPDFLHQKFVVRLPPWIDETMLTRWYANAEPLSVGCGQEELVFWRQRFEKWMHLERNKGQRRRRKIAQTEQLEAGTVALLKHVAR